MFGENMTGFKKVLTLCLFSITLVACSKAKEPSAEVGFCSVGAIPTAQCQHEVAGHKLTLFSSSPAMPEETAIDLYVELPASWVITRSQLSGESMYMGNIPVMWEHISGGRWLAKIRLGACTDPNMVWRLSFNIDTEQGPATTSVHFPVAAHP